MSDDLGPLPSVHPREERCVRARNELADFFSRLGDKHLLTPTELLRVVHNAASEFVSGYVRAAIRQERHGDAEKPGGTE